MSTVAAQRIRPSVSGGLGDRETAPTLRSRDEGSRVPASAGSNGSVNGFAEGGEQAALQNGGNGGD